MSIKFNSIDVESRKPLIPMPEYFDFSLATVEDFGVEMRDNADEPDKKGNKSEFAGIATPRFYIDLKNVKVDENDVDRFFRLSWGVVAIVTNDGKPMIASDIQAIYKSMFEQIVHIHNSCKSHPKYTSFKLSLLPDIDENAIMTVRAATMKKWFEVVESQFKTDTSDLFTNSDGSKIEFFIKLIADYKSQTRHEIPKFIGSGFIEVARRVENELVKPTLTFKANETIELKLGKGSVDKPSNLKTSTTTQTTNAAPGVADLLAKARAAAAAETNKQE